MPAHYAYQEPDRATLSQGDVLQKTSGLVEHLQQYHAYYANHIDYKYFMVVTQTCDLVRRDGACPSPYITIAAVRPLEEALRREAVQYQTAWQRDAGVIGRKAEEKLVLFLSSLLDNNQDSYFYLHQDIGLGIQQNCCAFLPLSVTLKIDHYQLCLDAKIAQLTETFQAKLGSIIGQLYSRVAAPEWNEHYPDNKVATEVASVLTITQAHTPQLRCESTVRLTRFQEQKQAQQQPPLTAHRLRLANCRSRKLVSFPLPTWQHL